MLVVWFLNKVWGRSETPQSLATPAAGGATTNQTNLQRRAVLLEAELFDKGRRLGLHRCSFEERVCACVHLSVFARRCATAAAALALARAVAATGRLKPMHKAAKALVHSNALSNPPADSRQHVLLAHSPNTITTDLMGWSGLEPAGAGRVLSIVMEICVLVNLSGRRRASPQRARGDGDC